MEIDIDGTANGVNFQAAALIVGGASLVVSTLENLAQPDGMV